MDVAASALLLMDLQEGYLRQLEEPQPLLAAVRGAADAARRLGLPVLYPCISFRPGQPEVSTRNRMFGSPEARGSMIEGTNDVRIPDEIAPHADDLVLTRPRTSAFAGSHLAEILRAWGVTSLYLGGIATSGVVLATALAADDLDLDVVVLADCVADPVENLSEVLLRDVLPQYGSVAQSRDVLAA